MHQMQYAAFLPVRRAEVTLKGPSVLADVQLLPVGTFELGSQLKRIGIHVQVNRWSADRKVTGMTSAGT
jgi:hypothetical protein